MRLIQGICGDNGKMEATIWAFLGFVRLLGFMALQGL